VVFPQTPLDVLIELYISGTWTDITSDVYTRVGISISRGRADYGQQVDPSRCSMTLNNQSGKYSSRNPLSPYYGLIGRNTPVQVSVRAGTPFLSLPGANSDVAFTPDDAALDITGDIDVRADAQLTNWLDASDSLNTTEIVGKLLAPSDKAWFLGVRLNRLYFEWSSDGSTALGASSTVQPAIPPSGRLAIRATFDVDNGSSGRTVTFYTAPSGVSGPWTQLGDPVVQPGTTSIFNSTASLIVGNPTNVAMTPAAGRCYALEIRNGIGGTVVASPDFTDQPVGITSFTDSAGRLWTLAGDVEITNRRTRFVGEVSSWPSRWDVSGNDVSVPVQAAGILRRLGQGAKVLQSAMRRELESPSRAGIVAYWPGEDDTDATQIASAIGGHPAMTVTGDVDMAAYSDWAASAALPLMKTGTLTASVPTYEVTNYAFTRFFMRVDPDGVASETPLLTLNTTGTAAQWLVTVRADSYLSVYAYDSDGVEIYSSAYFTYDLNGLLLSVAFELTQNGADVDWVLNPFDISASTLASAVSLGAASDTVIGQTFGRVTSIRIGAGGGLADTAVGHIALANSNTAYVNTNGAIVGWAGESAGARFLRITGEQSIPSVLAGIADDGILMGHQRSDELLDLLEEAADTDGGILYERRDATALVYRDRVSLYNQTVALTLDYTASGEVAPPLEPVEDDQRVRNDRTVKRIGGSAGRAVLESGPLSVQSPPDGVGIYDDSVDLSLYTDDQAVQIAAWRMHLGTVDEARYPQVRVDLAAGPHLAATATAVDVGDRIQIANPPAWLPPDTIDLLAEGYTETIGVYDWDIVYNCSPAGPWNVFVLGDPILGRADTSGSELASLVTASGTSLVVATDSGYRTWITTATHPTEFPFNAWLGGEVVRVTGITGTTSPQTWTVVRGVNGVSRSWPAGTRIRLSRSAVGL
jgi:hypothetical protein